MEKIFAEIFQLKCKGLLSFVGRRRNH